MVGPCAPCRSPTTGWIRRGSAGGNRDLLGRASNVGYGQHAVGSDGAWSLASSEASGISELSLVARATWVAPGTERLVAASTERPRRCREIPRAWGPLRPVS